MSSNVPESATWEAGVYQIATTDPVLGGPNGIANIQARQLANRTTWLKARADQVDAARGGFTNLQARLVAIDVANEALGPDMQNATLAALKFSIDQAALANYGVRALREQAQQQGTFTLINRGVVSGCVVTRSTTAARNLHISAGVCFAQGRSFAVADGNNAASVPSNTGTSSVQVTAFLHQDAAGLWRLAVTPIGTQVPAGGINIYTLVIPGNSTDATDPNLAHVTLTSVRRIEPHFPLMVDAPARADVVLANVLSASDYHLSFDVLSAAGAPVDASCLVASSRANNGFTVALASAADAVSVRYHVSKLNQ